ncbi:MBL fold metallo-hydrolase [Catellatospora bangladeshensis]|uniref:MBL fold metallo-hydrolase n=1 Tax=Catellatospora bangladeshensis TaxID=310355 RepID=UPI0036206FCA
MQLIKFTHACVRLEDGARRLLIDPGVWTEPAAYEGVTDILVTHEHYDHVDFAHLESLLKSRELRVYAPAAVRDVAAAEDAPAVAAAITPVATGDAFTAGGFAVNAVGGAHAEIYDGLPGCANLGYVVEGVYHPGDSFFVPEQPVTTLLVPAGAPWFKLRRRWTSPGPWPRRAPSRSTTGCCRRTSATTTSTAGWASRATPTTPASPRRGDHSRLACGRRSLVRVGTCGPAAAPDTNQRSSRVRDGP